MKKHTQRRLLRTTAIIALLVIPSYAQAGPEGGAVTSGSAAITSTGSITTIDQASDRAIIRWDSFDVGAGERVQFNQPGTSSITVNRIRDTKPSQIDGHVGANGNIILINPNGVVFGAASTVDVGGLVATSSDLRDDTAFMAGGAVEFTRPGNADAAIINHGAMTVREGGLAGLVAPNVENYGVIQARLGKAVLASGDIATVDFAGDGLIRLEVTDAVLSQKILNTGTISADGGDILLTAAQARGMVEAIITNTGTIHADTVTVANGAEARGGSVLVSTKGIGTHDARGASSIINTGTIRADAYLPDLSAGTITILSDAITIGDGSYVSATADVNGGTILIGGEYQGGGGLPTSDRIFLSEHAILNASSRRRGDGGRIILWSDTNTRFLGHADVSGGTEGGNGGFIEISGKETLDYRGSVNLYALGARGTLLLDPTDILISSGSDSNISGSSPFTPLADDGTTILNVNTLQAALASGNVIVQTRATGAQAGNITVGAAITWAGNNTLTLDAHNNIIVNQTISGNNLRFVAGNDVQLNAAVTGSGILTIQQAADSGTVGIGAGASGALNLNATDLSRITDGWDEIVIGKSTSTAAMDVRTTTWSDALTLKSGTGVMNIAGTVNTGANTLTIRTDGDINLTGALTGTGTLQIQQETASTGLGIGNTQTGAVNLTATETARITNGWANIILGRSDGTGTLNFGALTWNDNLTIQSDTGIININGTQTMGANNLSVATNADIVLTGSFTGSGILSIAGAAASTSIAFGNGETGTVNFSTAEVSRFTNGWASLVFGREDQTGTINIGALTWNDNITFQSGTGTISVNGVQTMGANNLTFTSGSDILLNAALTGTGTLTFRQNTADVSIGLGDGQDADIDFDTTDLARITNGWTGIVFGRTDGTADMNISALTWNDTVTFQTGTGIINITGVQTTNAAGMTIRTDSNVNIGANLIGSNLSFTLIQSSAGTSMGIGTGQSGTVHLTDEEMANILNGWGSLVFGRTDGTAALNVRGYAWSDPLSLRTGSGAMNINGAQSMAGNTLAITTDSDILIGGNLTGTGDLVIQNASAAVSMGLGDGQAGTIHLSNTELSRIANGWSNLFFGSTTMNGDMNIGAATWNDRTNFRTQNGVVSINGVQNYSNNAVTFTTSANMNVAAAMNGTSTLSISSSIVATTVGLGTGQAGTLHFTDTEIDLMMSTFSTVTIGNTNMSGAVNIGALTIKDPLSVINSSGLMSVNGNLSMGANNLTLTTNSNIVINGDLVGTGTLTIAPASAATTMGIGTGQAGTISMNDTKLARIGATWSNVIFGSTGMTGALNVGGRTWAHSVEYRTNTGALNINGVQNMGIRNLMFRTNTNLSIAQNLVGSGTISILPSTNATTMGIGDSQSGTLNLTNAELAFINNGWTNIILGSTSMTGAMNIGARTWNDSVDFRTNSGVISINGAQSMGGNNLVLRSNANPVIGAALSGTGNISFLNVTDTTTIGIGDTQAGTFNFTNAELAFISNGWNNIAFGSNAATGVMNVGAYTWNDNVTFSTSTGAININGAQTMGANNLTFRTSGNPAINAALSGTGTITFEANTASSSIGLAGASGTLNITAAELAHISNGWSDIIFGRNDGTGALAVNTHTWNDNVTFRSGAGVITIAGAQNAQSNNMTISTNANLAINSSLSGTGSLTIRGSAAATTMGIGNSQAGTLSLSNSELANIQNGWSEITFGNTATAGDIAIGAYNWNDRTSFVTRGNITLNGDQATSETSGTTLVFATINGSFINNAGADAINPGGGRYLVYSVSESSDTLDGIIRPGILTNKTYDSYGPALVVESGSQHIYSGVVSKILYLVIDDKEKAYGDALPTFTYTYISGLINGDLLTDIVQSFTMNALGASIFDDAGTVRSITGTATLNNGYTAVITDGALTVTKALLTVRAEDETRQYGLSNPSFTINYSGFKNGEDETDLNILATANSAATILSNVGFYNIVSSGAFDNNYDFVYENGTLEVTKAVLTAVMQNATREYGDANPAFTAVYSGFRNGDTVSVIDVLASGTTSATSTSNVGTYAISGFGAFDNNYTFNYVDGTLMVTKATLTATAGNVSRDYGDVNPAIGVTYTGFKNGETQSVIDTLATASSAANALSNVGTYATTASGAFDNNYTFNYVDGTLMVTKATLTATAGNVSRDYGDVNPAIGVTYTGFKNGETQSVIDTLASASSAANALSNVGTYATTASGAFDNNYYFNYVDGVLTVNKATLTATAGNVSRDYGDANPVIGVTYTGFKNGETQSVIDTLATASSAANALSNVGTYATTASGAFDNNYNFNYVNGVLTVNKANVIVRPDDKQRKQGQANPPLTLTYTGLRNGENVSVIDTLATAATIAVEGSPIGTYAITASGAFDGNYTFTYINGVLTVQDPDFIPTRPPVQIPSTVQSVLNAAPVRTSFVSPQTQSFAPVSYTGGQVTNFVIVEEKDIFFEWGRDDFLIALTRPVQEYFRFAVEGER